MQKRAKMHFQNSYKKGKNAKKETHFLESTFFGMFLLLYPCALFGIFNLKIHARKNENAKKGKQNFQILGNL